MHASNDDNALAPSASLEAIEKQTTELSAHIHAASYRLLCLIAEFDRREGWAQRGVLSCAHWLYCHDDLDGWHRLAGGPGEATRRPQPRRRAGHCRRLPGGRAELLRRGVQPCSGIEYRFDHRHHAMGRHPHQLFHNRGMAVDALLSCDGALQLEAGARHAQHFPR